MLTILTRNDLASIKEGEKENISPEARSDYDYLTNHQTSYDTSVPSDFGDLHNLGVSGDLNLEKYLLALKDLENSILLREGRHLGLLGGGLGLGGYGQLQLVYYIRSDLFRISTVMMFLPHHTGFSTSA